MRLTISLLFTLLMASSALAQFKVTPNPEVNYGNGSFECGIVRLYPRENDDDPIYKINLFLIFKDGEPPTLESMSVTHYSVTGKNYPRSDQYTSDTLVRTPNKFEIIWRGIWKKNRGVVMTGRFWNDSTTRRWYYSENQTKNGIMGMRMLSICHSVEAE